jgi:hypothetical protein
MVRIAVLAAFAKAMADSRETNLMTVQAGVDALLHFRSHHRAPQFLPCGTNATSIVCTTLKTGDKAGWLYFKKTQNMLAAQPAYLWTALLRLFSQRTSPPALSRCSLG